jgi:hypothetical protein
MRKQIAFFLCLGVALLFSSCQSGKEFHYFKQGDNYYRLRVSEYAFLSSSRYQSGYYDETAVDNYFGEIRRPDSTGRIIPVPVNTSTTDTEVKAAEKATQGTKLVMILSTNSEAVSGQISALADNEQTLELIARLSNKDIKVENLRLKEKVRQLNAKDNALQELGAATIEGIADADKTVANLPDIRNKLLVFINALAASTGRKIPFTNFNEAQTWFNETF